MTQADLPSPEDALAHYDLEPITNIGPAGGTAGRTWKVSTRGPTYFLRLRGARTSTPERLVYDHGLRCHLAKRGVPTAMALRTKQNERWLSLADRVFELYPFVEGCAFDFASKVELASAAQALAQFHEAGKDYQPPAQYPIEVAQYAWLGFCSKASDRMDDPELQAANIEAIAMASHKSDEIASAKWALTRAERLRDTNAGEPYQRLLGWVVHGDYTPANLLFTPDGQVTGIFDLDWAMPMPRCRDIGDALYFFAGDRRAIDSSDIWRLTEAVQFDFEKCVRFLRAYHEASPLSEDELDAIPYAFEGRWLSIRLEGMAKVPEAERLRFFGRGDIHIPLEWLDEHWQAVRRSALSQQATALHGHELANDDF